MAGGRDSGRWEAEAPAELSVAKDRLSRSFALPAKKKHKARLAL
jgi:hypothetical protein